MFILRTKYGPLGLWITYVRRNGIQKIKPIEGSGVTSPVFLARRPEKLCKSHADLLLAVRRLRSGKRVAHALKNSCCWTETTDDAFPAQMNATPSFPIQRWSGVDGRGMAAPAPPLAPQLATVTIPPASNLPTLADTNSSWTGEIIQTE